MWVPTRVWLLSGATQGGGPGAQSSGRRAGEARLSENRQERALPQAAPLAPRLTGKACS